MKNLKFEHFGLAISDIEEYLRELSKIFKLKSISKPYRDKLQNVKVKFIDVSGIKIELIEPLNRHKKSPVDNLIKNNILYYHLCFSTNNLQKSILNLKNNGAIVVMNPQPAPAYNKRKIAFLFIKPLRLIELVEREVVKS